MVAGRRAYHSVVKLDLPVDKASLDAFCRRWSVAELAAFGSVVRGDSGPESDVDLLVTFAPEARPTLFDLAVIQGELAALFGRNVDLATRAGVEASRNPLRREAILSSAQLVHATR